MERVGNAALLALDVIPVIPGAGALVGRVISIGARTIASLTIGAARMVIATARVTDSPMGFREPLPA